MSRIFLSNDGAGMHKLKVSLMEDYHSDNELNWIENTILDIVNMIDLDYSLDYIVSSLKEDNVSDDMIFLATAAAKIYANNRTQ